MVRGTLAALAVALFLAAPASAAQPYHVSYHAFALPKTGVTFDNAPGGVWTSPWFQTGFGFTELVSSWNADTPAGTWIQIDMHATTDRGTTTKWYTMGRWAFGDGDIQRTSVGGQGDADGFVSIDTFFAKDHPLTSYQLRLTLYRVAGSSATPRLTRIGAVASDPINSNPYVPSATTMTSTKILAVPEYSQEIHAGHYPEFDGGGEAWCSPTSTSMILGYWNRLPSPADYAFVTSGDASHPDPWVDYAARFTYDYNYNGAGNWPFNVAYAHTYGLEGAVTQLRSLAEAEQYIKAGIPLVASLSFGSGKLDGFPFKSTNGHLLTIVGFTADGNVVSNDPAALTDADVQRTYNRAQFEKAWMESTGGLVYLLYAPGTTLPAS